MKKWVKWLIAIVIIVVLAGVIIAFLNKDGKDAATNSSNNDGVETKVKQGEMKIDATATGVIAVANKVAPDYEDLELQVQMDELDIPNIKVDQEVTINVAALPDRTFKGKVKQIAEQGQVQNGVSSFPVVISLDKTDGLKAGMTADASILVQEKSNAIYLPIEAVQKDDDNRYYVMLPKKDKNGKTKKEKKIVKTGLHNEDNIEITKGLSKGDKVILPSNKSNTQASGF
ncbi:HlyD family efflux transporter periplasmic adaptor subunit [Listeria aquatica]|uniref:HlyD family efflux transporter periplasmic adaptor subunit n=1 Tax=Listeria aquatica TaxID=1494960 RepID=A0A841ZSR3_9LIST|nr:HlyD family secretion protein [Listeria aquatica]MBC1521641.1 HlyD family efflux transporter periplasmic adaptor subunit [Listeria aquatica]